MAGLTMRAVAAALALLYGIDVVVHVAATTTISTFSDTECKKSIQKLDAQNGYPDGVCTSFRRQATSPYQSFMFNSIDHGCSVTLYGDDATAETCSATLLAVTQLATCYNSTWQYYSVDMCTPPSLVPTSAAPTPIPTDTATADSGGGSNTGAIVGGVVGGVVFLVAVASAALFFLWVRPRARRREAKAAERAAAAAAEAEEEERKWKSPAPLVEAPGPGPTELPPGYYLDHELNAESPPAELPSR